MSSFCHQESSASSDSSCEHNVHDNLAELSPQERQRAFALRFRTEMCRSYVSTGRCEYRDRCMFAHGDRELRTEAMNETEGLVCDKAIRAWMRERRLAAAQQSRCRGGNMRGVAVVTRASYTAPRPVMAPRRVEVALTVEVAQPQQPIKKIAESPAESELFVPANLSRSTTTSVSSSEGINPTAPVVPAIKGYRFNPYSMILPKVYA